MAAHSQHDRGRIPHHAHSPEAYPCSCAVIFASPAPEDSCRYASPSNWFQFQLRDLTFSEARRTCGHLNKFFGATAVFLLFTKSFFQNWRHHGKEEIEATRMDPRRRSRIEGPRQAEDSGEKDCSKPQTNGRCDATKGVQLGGIARLACLAREPRTNNQTVLPTAAWLATTIGEHVLGRRRQESINNVDRSLDYFPFAVALRPGDARCGPPSLNLHPGRNAEADFFGVTFSIKGEEARQDFIAEVGPPEQAAGVVPEDYPGPTASDWTALLKIAARKYSFC
jgi:hypothetical protein